MPLLLPPPRCELCGDASLCVRMRSSRTAYTRPLTARERRDWEERHRAAEAAHLLGGEAVLWGVPLCMGDDVANRDLSLCCACAEEHDAYWDERWAEYHSAGYG